MLDKFTQEYKQIMLDAENRAKQFGYEYIFPEDILLHISRLTSGNIADLFADFGINEPLLLDLFSRPPFLTNILQNRTGPYLGLSDRLKELIVPSMNIAAGFGKSQAWAEDFLLALIRSKNESWFAQLLDFIGISPSYFEDQIVKLNNLISRGNMSNNPQNVDEMFGPIDEIMNMIEDHFGGVENSNNPNSNPFMHNSPQEKRDSKTPALDFFGVDLVAEAKNKKIDPVIGRNTEIDRLISILNRKTKNNPCLVGEPWVGKTAVVEGLARRIADGEVPFAMQNKRIVMLDLSAMIAGTKFRWEFENRIKMVIDEASTLENEVILFIDEIHTIIGAGSGEGTMDAANILKPAMARGKISLIGATTLNEYQKYIEKDSALERRFQKIDVPEPTACIAREIIFGLRKSFEDFHNLIIEDSAINDAIELSTRYITDRFLPDKAIDLLDEACSAKSMTYNFSSEEAQNIKEKIEKIQNDMNSLVMSQQYQKALIKQKEIQALEKELEQTKKKRKIPLKDRLKITGSDVQKIIHQTTGVPLKNLQKEDLTKLKNLDKILKKRIIGQNEAIDSIVSSLKRSQVGISRTERPIGSFLFLGPTGVGKTELVKVLAEEFYSDPKALIKVDMSEFNSQGSASKLIGTTAGYVGYEEWWMLTDKVRRKPYSIVLFDEIEKANFDIYNLFLQILEDGVVTDGKWRQINFKNTIIIMTSNLGSEEFNEKASQIGFNISENDEKKIISDFDSIRDKVISQLPEFFAPEFINRIDKTIVFRPIDQKNLKQIISLQLDELTERLKKIWITISFDKKAISTITDATYTPEFGARPVRRYIQDFIEDKIADHIVFHPKNKIVSVSSDKDWLTFSWE